MKFGKLLISFTAVFFLVCNTVSADPIERITGLVVGVNEGYLWVIPTGKNETERFVLNWKVRFTPSRLPIKGDHVVLLYKNKDEGRIIYGINFCQPSTDVLPVD